MRLKNILGKSTDREYTDDRETFIYEFDQIETIPITVYLDAESGVIQTVFIELLGLEESFEKDLKLVNSEFPLKPCHSNLFGKLSSEIIKIMGSPDYNEIIDDNVENDVESLIYISEQGNIEVTFNFYRSQNKRLSSINVNWYDKEVKITNDLPKSAMLNTGH